MGIANIRNEILRLTSLPTVVINSHCHYDHIGGNMHFFQVWAFNHPFEIDRIEAGYTVAECKKFMQPECYKDLPLEFDLTPYCIHPSVITKKLCHLEESDVKAYRATFKYLVDLLDQISCLCPAHNEAYLPKEKLIHFLEAFERIASDQAEFEVDNKTRLYSFEGFKVRLPTD